MGPDGVISPHLLDNGLIMSIWRRLGMGSTPYTPVIPLVICLPPAPTDWHADGSETQRSILIVDQPPVSHQKTPTHKHFMTELNV